MNDLLELLTHPLTGDLDFLNGERIVYADGHLMVPVQLIKRIYNEALAAFSTSDEGSRRTSSQVLVLLNPEYMTAFNHRKKLVQLQYLDMKSEYQFTSFLLTKHSAKPRVWEYRAWLYNLIGKRERNLAEDIRICNLTADRYPCNYPSWGFRRMIQINTLPQNTLRFDALKLELLESNTFVDRHVSDSSGWSYRQRILYLLGDQLDTESIEIESAKTQSMILLYPNHESLWIHARFLCQLFRLKIDTERWIEFAQNEGKQLENSVRFLSFIDD